MKKIITIRVLALSLFLTWPLLWAKAGWGCPNDGNATGEILFAEGNTSSVTIRANVQDPDGLKRVSIVFVPHGAPLRLCDDSDPDNACPETLGQFEALNIDPFLYGVTGIGDYILGLWVVDDNEQAGCVDSLEIEIFGAAFQKFRPTRSMAASRSGHSATALASGEILVTGGWDGQDYRSDSEIYHPATGQWRSTGSLNEARSGHSAVRLISGAVLVVGGQDGSPEISAEIFDPWRETWTSVGGDTVTRVGHTATLMPSGEVLVVGGRGASDLTLAEIYSSEGLRRLTQAIPGARAFHTATLLRGGQVLVAGGFQGANPLQTTRVFNPEDTTWSEAPSMLDARGKHTTTLLADGRIIATGGSFGNGIHPGTEILDPEAPNPGWRQTGLLNERRADHIATLLPSGEVLVAGGRHSAPLLGAEVFNPVNETWFPVEGMLTPRSSLAASLLSTGQVLVSGGSGEGGSILASAEVFDPVPFLWFRGPEMSIETVQHSATSLADGRVLVAGGAAHVITLDRVEIYDSTDRSWTLVNHLNEARRKHTATLLPSGDVLVTGGANATTIATTEVYSVAGDSWVFKGDLIDPRRDHTATLLPSGEVLVVGGTTTGGAALATAELFDPDTGSWRLVGSMTEARHHHGATLLPSGKVLVSGGRSLDPPTFHASCEIYDPATEEWTDTEPLSGGRESHTATLLPSGQVLVSGGHAGSAMAATELYAPNTRTWSDASSLEFPRYRHTATLLDNGTVLVTGGYRNGSVSVTEIYDPGLDSWQTIWQMGEAREQHSATLLPTGEVLIVGGYGPIAGQNGDALNTTELLTPPYAEDRRPLVASIDSPIQYGELLMIEGQRLRGSSEAAGGSSQSSAADLPLIQLRSLEDTSLQWLTPNADSLLSGDPQSLSVDRFPPGLTPGWHSLRIFAAGIPSLARGVLVECSLVIVGQPADQSVEVGATATFEVEAQGARSYQWLRDGSEIADATESSYTTPPVAASDSGTEYSVEVDSGCTRQVSEPARLTILDDTHPEARVLFPNGGEIFTTSDPDPNQAPNQELIRWTASDNIRLCRVEVSLWVSTDGGNLYDPAPAGGGLPDEFGSADACPHPGVETEDLVYTLPTEPPVEDLGARYKIQVQVTDQAMLTTTVRSEGYFQIIEPSPDSVRTLILASPARMQTQMGLTTQQVEELMAKLQALADHGEVVGQVLNLDSSPNLTSLYEDWDANPEDPQLANQVLFAEGGLHEVILDRRAAFRGLEYIVLVGDDGIIPMARLPDRGYIFTESNYPLGGDLNLDPTLGPVPAVAHALEADLYLSDDPIAVLSAFPPEELGTSLFIPDLMVGRLVETPAEIMGTVDLFIAQGGGIDLTAGDPETQHKVQVTAYDFLRDLGMRVRQHWKAHFVTPTPDASLAPVDGTLVGQGWNEFDLKERLCGEGSPYSVINLNGHASHYQEGVPADDPQIIAGLETRDLISPDACMEPPTSPLRLNGAIVYSVGCHGGLPVRGSDPFDINHSLDLPQTLMSIGALAYLSNSGYGWGLKYGIGYSERLVQIFTELLTSEDRATVGEVFRRAKLNYYLRNAYFDTYDEKTMMQWAFYGLPMYSVRVRDSGDPRGSAPAQAATGGNDLKGGLIGKVKAWSTVPDAGSEFSPRAENVITKGSAPPFVVPEPKSFILTADGVASKWTADGDQIDVNSPCQHPEGCYYEVYGQSIAKADLPIEPVVTVRSKIVGASQHGVLWKGGLFEEETGWTPVIGEPVSNGGTSNPGTLPQHIIVEPIAVNITPGQQTSDCRSMETEINTLTVTTGELLKENPTDPTFNVHRLYRRIDLEVFYFNNADDPSQNCDRIGPTIGAPTFGDSYHNFNGQTLQWAVPASDNAGVWRVVVVYTDGTLDSDGHGSWTSLELQGEDNGTWTGSLELSTFEEFTYVVQMVDQRGNVSWLRRESTTDSLGAPSPNLPRAVQVDLAAWRIFSDGFETGDSSAWSQSRGE